MRGTGQGDLGPDADKGSYDALAFWARAGVAYGAKRPEVDDIPMPPAPAFGDSIGAITIAGAIMGALFHRERTGDATVVDVSLLATGCGRWARRWRCRWLAMPWTAPRADRVARTRCTRNYRTSDGRTITLTCLQPGQYWPPMCDVIGARN